MTPAEALIVGIAAWRLAHFAVYEGGPWGAMQWIRERVGIEHDVDGRMESFADTLPANLLTCVWCTSAWTAVVGYGMWVAAPTAIYIVAIWGIASAAETIIGRARE